MTRGWIALAALMTAACGSKPITPGPTPVADAPQLACPADVSVRGVTGLTQPVSLPAPALTGGATPVNVTCTQTSGASFPLGTTSVSCTASDAMARQASCSFRVTLTGQALSITKYEAFGDSLTEGEVGRPNIIPSLVDVPNAYPTRLQAAFDELYPGQGVTVLNRGLSGDPVEVTLAKIVRFLPGDRPGAVLLLTGYNNLTGPCGSGQASTVACRGPAGGIEQVAFGVRDCIRGVKESNAGVKFIFVSTLTPPGPSGSHRIDANAIVQTNVRIQQMVAAEGAVLVDSYGKFVGHEVEYVNVDGLHLRPAGYQALADSFFAAIRATVPQTPLFGMTSPF